MSAKIFRHTNRAYDDLFVGVRDGVVVACSRSEGMLGEFDIDDMDRLYAAYECAATRTQGICDLAEFFEDCTIASLAQSFVIAEIAVMCCEQIAVAVAESTKLSVSWDD